MPDAREYLDRARRARREDRPADARRDFEAALAVARASELRPHVIEALKGMAEVKRDMGDLDGALSLYEEAVGLFTEGEDVFQLAHTIRHLADVHREAGHTEAAESSYDRALQIYRSFRHGPRLDLANAIRGYALLKETVGDRAAARRSWREARDLYAAADVSEGVQECSAHLSDLGEAES